VSPATVERPAAGWLREVSREPWPELRLVCLPYAGGSGAAYRSWPLGLPRGVEVLAVELPGRGTRAEEPPSRLLDAIVTGVTDALRELPARRSVLFGHSLGAVVAFEVARRLRGEGLPGPELLVVAAREAPHVGLRREPVYALPDDEFLDALAALGGTPPEVLAEPDLLAVAMASLRADFEIADTYADHRRVDRGGGHRTDRPLDVPILALGGTHDPDVEPSDLDGWREYTSAGFRSAILPGSHFFVKDAEPVFLRLLARELDALLEAAT
jgi:medium-chain acyl-[acyl-carrier-protein] hydrolase